MLFGSWLAIANALPASADRADRRDEDDVHGGIPLSRETIVPAPMSTLARRCRSRGPRCRVGVGSVGPGIHGRCGIFGAPGIRLRRGALCGPAP